MFGAEKSAGWMCRAGKTLITFFDKFSRLVHSELKVGYFLKSKDFGAQIGKVDKSEIQCQKWIFQMDFFSI